MLCVLKVSFYSYLRALIGSNSAALRAGYQPKNTPVMVHTKKDITIEYKVILTGQPINSDTPTVANKPITTPRTPPVILNKHRLDKELRQNILALSPNSHTQAYFLSALFYRYVHNVHNAYTAHDERNAGNSY